MINEIRDRRDEAAVDKTHRGMSMIELVVVLTIIGVLSAISVPYLFRYTQKYKTEDQALKVMDLMREAGQLALNRRRSIRFELNVTDTRRPVVNLRDGATLIKSIPLEPLSEVRTDVAPAATAVPNPPNYAIAAFSSGVWTVDFRSDGTVLNTAATPTPVSATLFFWSPKNQQPFTMADLTPRAGEVRAITIFGGSGAVRYWKHNGSVWSAWQ